MIFNSLAFSKIEGCGTLNFFGEKQTQSQLPLKGYAPDVSIWVLSPAFFSETVNGPSSYIAGSPPVITAIGAFVSCALVTICCMLNNGWADASHDSFTSHHTQPT